MFETLGPWAAFIQLIVFGGGTVATAGIAKRALAGLGLDMTNDWYQRGLALLVALVWTLVNMTVNGDLNDGSFASGQLPLTLMAIWSAAVLEYHVVIKGIGNAIIEKLF